METETNSKNTLAYFVFALAVIVAFLPWQEADVSLAIWDNILGTLGAFSGVFSLIAYSLSGVSTLGNPNYVPLWAYASFKSADLEIVSRTGLTMFEYPGRLSGSIWDHEYLLWDFYDRAVLRVTLGSIGVWGLLITLVILSFRLTKKRAQAGTSARAAVLIAWVPIVLVPVACKITVYAFHAINAAATFAVMGALSLIIFLIAGANTTPTEQTQH